jgi:hypothetical protein
MKIIICQQILVILATTKFHENSFSISRVRNTNRYDRANAGFVKLCVLEVYKINFSMYRVIPVEPYETLSVKKKAYEIICHKHFSSLSPTVHVEACRGNPEISLPSSWIWGSHASDYEVRPSGLLDLRLSRQWLWSAAFWVVGDQAHSSDYEVRPSGLLDLRLSLQWLWIAAFWVVGFKALTAVTMNCGLLGWGIWGSHCSDYRPSELLDLRLSRQWLCIAVFWVVGFEALTAVAMNCGLLGCWIWGSHCSDYEVWPSELLDLRLSRQWLWIAVFWVVGFEALTAVAMNCGLLGCWIWGSHGSDYKVWSFGLWHRLVWGDSGVSKEHNASIFRVEKVNQGGSVLLLIEPVSCLVYSTTL